MKTWSVFLCAWIKKTRNVINLCIFQDSYLVRELSKFLFSCFLAISLLIISSVRRAGDTVGEWKLIHALP